MSTTICSGVGKRYQSRVRFYGHKSYILVGKPTRSYRKALYAMVAEFQRSQLYKRADVLMTADYYDPLQLCELVRR